MVFLPKYLIGREQKFQHNVILIGRETSEKRWTGFFLVCVMALLRLGLGFRFSFTREKPLHRFALDSRPIKTHVMLKLLLSTNQIFRQENHYALLL